MKRADLDVIGADRVRAAAQALDAVDAQRRSCRCRRSARRARRGSGRGPARAARTRRCRARSRPRASDGGHDGVLRAVTLASSRKTFAPRGRRCASRSGRLAVDLGAELCERVQVRVERARRPMTSPPGGATSRCRNARAAGRRAGTTRAFAAELRGSGLDFDTFAVCTRTSFGPAHDRRRRGRRAGRASSRRRGSAGRCAAETSPSVSRVAARIGSAPFLFPAARIAPFSGREPSMKNASATAGATAKGGNVAGRATHPRTGLADADEVHEERVAAASRARRRGLDRRLRASSAGTRSSGGSRRCSTTSTTRSTRRSTSIRRTARRSSARRATPRR